MHQLGRHGLSRAAIGVVAAECAKDVVAVAQGSFTHFVGRSHGAGRHNVLRFGQGAHELGGCGGPRPPAAPPTTSQLAALPRQQALAWPAARWLGPQRSFFATQRADIYEA